MKKALIRALMAFILLILIMAVYLGLHSTYILPFWVTTLKAILMATAIFWGVGWIGKSWGVERVSGWFGKRKKV